MPDTGGYLPPVVATVTADSAEFIRVLEDAKALLADFAKNVTSAKLGGDADPLYKTLADAKVALADMARQVTDAKLGADATPFWADIARLKAELDAMSPLDVRVDANVSAALAEIAALKGALASAQTGGLIDAAGTAAAGKGGGKSGSGGALAGGLLGSLFGTGNKGALGGLLWGNTGGGFISQLLSPLTGLATMFSAGFGSVGSFAGFGPEHLLMTGLGLAGSAGEAAAGGGLLALGSLGKAGVGSGSDALATKTALAGVSAFTQLSTAVAEYGANSTQAQAAASQLAFAMRGDSQAALAAESGIASAAESLKVQWHAASSDAQVQATNIMAQVLGLASAYTGRVGAAAAANLAIINTSLKPLFAWLKGPAGVGVFTSLETLFRNELPTAIHAFDEGVELLLRTMALAGSYTGGFVTKLDAFLTRTNSPTGFSKWSSEIAKLVGDFHMWGAMLSALGHDLRSLFKNDAGEPAAMIQGLTSALQKLGAWEDSAAGKASIFAVFASHKGEILQLASAISHLGLSFGKVYLTVAPAFVTAVTTMLRAVNPLLNALAKNPAGAWVLGLGLIAAKMGAFNPLVKALGNDIKSLALSATRSFLQMSMSAGKSFAAMVDASSKWVAGQSVAAAKSFAAMALSAGKHFAAMAASASKSFVAMIAASAKWVAEQVVMAAKTAVTAAVTAAKWVAATAVIVASFAAQAAAATAAFIMENAATLGIIAGITLLVAAIVYLATHWSQVWRDIKKWTSDAVDWIKSHLLLATLAFGPLVVAIVEFASHWSEIWNTAKSVIQDVWNVIKPILDGISSGVKDVTSGISDLENVAGGIGKGLGAVGSFLHIPHLAGGGLVSQPTLALVGEAGPEMVIPLSTLQGLTSPVAPLGASLGSSAAPANPQLDRIEKLLSSILVESKATSTNTKATVTATQGLSSPPGVAAQIARANTQLITSLRAGSSR